MASSAIVIATVAAVAAHVSAAAVNQSSIRSSTSGRTGLRASLSNQLEQKFIIDPGDNPERVDIDLAWWENEFRTRSTAPVRKSNLWKADPKRDLRSWESHMTKSLPTPPEWIEWKECVALRNARELAENLGNFDHVGEWPSCQGTSFKPKHNHTGEDAELHVDDLPCAGGKPEPTPDGVMVTLPRTSIIEPMAAKESDLKDEISITYNCDDKQDDPEQYWMEDCDGDVAVASASRKRRLRRSRRKKFLYEKCNPQYDAFDDEQNGKIEDDVYYPEDDAELIWGAPGASTASGTDAAGGTDSGADSTWENTDCTTTVEQTAENDDEILGNSWLSASRNDGNSSLGMSPDSSFFAENEDVANAGNEMHAASSAYGTSTNKSTARRQRRRMREEALSCLLYTSPSPRDGLLSRMPSSA